MPSVTIVEEMPGAVAVGLDMMDKHESSSTIGTFLEEDVRLLPWSLLCSSFEFF